MTHSMGQMHPLIVTSGEPAGIGPDICLSLAGHPLPLVVLGDLDLLRERAQALNLNLHFRAFCHEKVVPAAQTLWVWHVPVKEKVKAGQLNPENSAYVLKLLDLALERCLSGEFSALVTAPVHKGVINDAGVHFSGHTEYLADACKVKVVMLLVCEAMKVALVTTHIPLSAVSAAITPSRLKEIIAVVHQGMQTQFGLTDPRILVAGLNPHAGEGGHLGREEIEIIEPVLRTFQDKGYDIQGPFPADTLFTPPYLEQADVIIAMYHDQGLSVLKYAGFGEAVNVTLGLPIIRTSVDHGTALPIAGKGQANPSSMYAAVTLANKLANKT